MPKGTNVSQLRKGKLLEQILTFEKKYPRFSNNLKQIRARYLDRVRLKTPIKNFK